MERVSFRDQRNVELLNKNYYALKFNLETKKEIVFNGKSYKNQELKINRQPSHELAKFLTGKQDQISLPAIIILNEDYKNLRRIHSYLSPKNLYLLINQ